MSIVGSLDAIAIKVEAVDGIKRAYSLGLASGSRPIPRNIDSTPVATVYMGGAEGHSGNFEAVLMSPTVDVWMIADDAGIANKTLAQLLDPLRNAFRVDMNLGGECTRCEMVGWDEPSPQQVGDRTFLVLRVRLEVLIERFGSDATA